MMEGVFSRLWNSQDLDQELIKTWSNRLGRSGGFAAEYVESPHGARLSGAVLVLTNEKYSLRSGTVLKYNNRYGESVGYSNIVFGNRVVPSIYNDRNISSFFM